MQMIKLECPNCGSNLEVNDTVSKCFCTYCGTAIVLYDKTNIIESNRTARQAMKSRANMHIADRNADIAKYQSDADRSENKANVAMVAIVFTILFLSALILTFFT